MLSLSKNVRELKKELKESKNQKKKVKFIWNRYMMVKNKEKEREKLIRI